MTNENNSAAGAYDLAASVSYQAGNIVSRTMVNKPAGTVTLFAFAVGQALSEHTAPYDAQVVVLDGQAEVTIDGKAYSVNTGETILLPAGKPHGVNAVSDFKMLLIMIKA